MALELFITPNVISAFAFYGDQSADVSPLCLPADFLLKPQRFSPALGLSFKKTQQKQKNFGRANDLLDNWWLHKF